MMNNSKTMSSQPSRYQRVVSALGFAKTYNFPLCGYLFLQGQVLLSQLITGRGDFRRCHARVFFGSPSIPFKQNSGEKPCAWGMVLVQKRPLQYRFEDTSRLHPACAPLSRSAVVGARISEKCAKTPDSPLSDTVGETRQPQSLFGGEKGGICTSTASDWERQLPYKALAHLSSIPAFTIVRYFRANQNNSVCDSRCIPIPSHNSQGMLPVFKYHNL